MAEQAMRPLGRSGLKIAPLMLGGNVFGWTADQATSFRVLDRFVDAGLNAIDTAEVYSAWVPGHTGGESETVLGDWFARSGKRDKVVLATKVGWANEGQRGLQSAANIMRGVEDSLRRLKTDVIDLYQSHTDDPATPFEETLGAFARLIEQGKVRAIGASNISAERFAESLKVSAAHGLPRYETVQPPYNLYQRDIEAALQPLCVTQGVSVISYYGLASGFLTGKYRSEADLGQSPRGRSVGRYLNPRGFRILDAMEAVARRLDATLAQVSLAWIMTRPAVAAPIVSATSTEQLNELIGAATLELDAEALQALEAASAPD